MMKIMEDIFTGTMNRFMGSGELTPHAEVYQSTEKGKVYHGHGQLTTFNIIAPITRIISFTLFLSPGSKRVVMTSGDGAEIANSQYVQTGGNKKKTKVSV